MLIGTRIRNRRIELNMTQEELAQKVGYTSRSSINKLESAREIPSSKIRKLAVALETTESYLMGWDDEELTSSDSKSKILLDAYNNLSVDKQYAVDSFIVCIGNENIALESRIQPELAYNKYKEYFDMICEMDDEQRDAVFRMVKMLHGKM